MFALLYLIYSVSDKIVRFFKDYEIKRNDSERDLEKRKSKSKKPYDLDYRVKAALVFTALLVALSLIVPILIVYDENTSTFNFEGKGNIGDTLGGAMNPFIALAGVVVTGLAFYMQYRANKIQRELFDDGLKESRSQFSKQLESQQEQFMFQQYENQFFEMLRLHKENTAEMAITGYIFEKRKEEGVKDEDNKTTDDTGVGDSDATVNNANESVGEKMERSISGRKIFVAMNKEFKSCYQILNNVALSEGYTDIESIFKVSYYIFFLGLADFKREMDNLAGSYSIDRRILVKGYKELKEAQRGHFNNGNKKYKNVALEFNYKPYTGHQSRLAHYYRHLFQLLKFVTKERDFRVKYQKKRDLLRILRAQLSNYEQLLLFYNWYADFGDEWEEKDFQKRSEKKGNYYFTDYRMIHNLPPRLLLEGLDLNSVFTTEYRYFMFEKGRKQWDKLFELADIVSLSDSQDD